MNLYRCAGCAAVYAFTEAEYDDDRCHCKDPCCSDELLHRIHPNAQAARPPGFNKRLDTNPTTP